jgi:4-hydroxybenzoate polyprenyltransferase
MKILGFPSFLAILMGAVISYGFYALFGNGLNQKYEITHACFSFIILSSTLVSAFGLVHDSERTNTLLKTIGLTFFILLLILFVILSVFSSSIPALITLSALFYLTFLLSMYKVYTSNQ